MSISTKDYNEVVQYCLVRQFLTNIEDQLATVPPSFKVDKNNELTQFYSINWYDFIEENTNTQNSSNLTISKLSSMRYPKELLQTTSKDLSSLVSKIKLTRHPVVDQKIDYDQKNAYEIAFDTAYNKKAFSSIIQDRTGCGIKSLNIDVFSDTGAYYRHNVALVLTFANAKILAKNQEFVDLLKTPGRSGKRDIAYKLECGWHQPSGKLANIRNKPLFQNKLLLILQLVNYQLAFSQDGSVSLTVNFIGRTDDASKDFARNCLTVNAYLQTRQNQLKEKIKALETEILNNVSQRKNLETEKIKLNAEFESKKAKVRLLLEAKLKQQQIGAENAKRMGDNYAFKNSIDKTKQKIVENEKSNEIEKQGPEKQYDTLIARTDKQIENLNKEIQTERENLDRDIAQYFFSEVLSNAQVYRGHVEKKTKEPSYKLTLDFADNLFKQQFGHLFGNQEVEETFPLDDSISEEFIRNIIKPVVNVSNSSESSESDVYHFTYLHVGDIIDIASKHFRLNMAEVGEENIEIVLGNVDVTTQTNLKEGFENGLLNAIDIINTQHFACPLYRFPISYNFFNSWYSENVVKKNRINYAFADFIKDFLNGCVLHTLENFTNFFNNIEENQDSGMKVIMKRQFKDSTIHVEACDLPFDLNFLTPDAQLTGAQGTKPNKQLGIPYENWADSLTIQDKEKSQKRSLPRISINDLEQAFEDGKFVFNSNEDAKPVPHILIYADTGYIKQNGDFQENMKNGIFHFFVGAETGILKDCQFAPVANPHRQTVQIQSALNGDNTKFNATQRYDVNIKCKGFQYFKPGQIIFVDTQLIGFGDSMHPGDIAADYNLGGYYLIIKAGHEFVGMDFETNITAKFINNGRSV